MSKYLITKCVPLMDQYECDYERTPICMVDDYSKYYEEGYEIYELLDDNTFTCIKQADECGEEGFALVTWIDLDEDDDPNDPDARIYANDMKRAYQTRYKGLTRKDITKDFVKKIAKKAGFSASPTYILNELKSMGEYGEEIYNHRLERDEWVVFGQYHDWHYPTGC